MIADPDAQVAKAFDAYKEEWKVAARATAIIGEDGAVLKTYPEAPIDGKGHVEKVYADAEALFS